MIKGKLVFLSMIVAVALLSWQIMPAGVNDATSGVVSSVNSTVAGAGGCYLVCPQGDGRRFEDVPAIVSLTVRDVTNTPIVGIIAADIWMIGSADLIALCGGSGSINADSATSAFTPGFTTISGDLAGGGCDLGGLYVVVQGVILNAGPAMAYWVMSPDLNGDLLVSLPDFSNFEIAYQAQPGAYDACMDFNCDGQITLPDFAIFGLHYGHNCP